MSRRIELINEDNAKLAKQLQEMRDQISKVIQERDQFRSELQETLKGKKQVEFRFDADRKSNKEREATNVKKITLLTKEKGDNEDEILNL